MSEAQAGPKPKKSVALSGVAAGSTALCTVGRSGNDLHYRGYDILDIAEQCEFEELAYLLVHEKLPNRAELAAYKARLKTLRALPAAVRTVLEQIPASAHPMDVLRTGCSALGAVQPEKEDHPIAGARAIVAAGGEVLTEAESSCVVYGMPRAVRQAGLSVAEAPLERMLSEIGARL